ncbi:MAG: hypothetical protein U5L76_03765 [Patescibacteria group bacterium]|nr:hypothetical protein [Patescibacteria group bacterium]
MKNRVIILTLSLVVILVVFSITALNKNLSQENNVNPNSASDELSRSKQEKIRIAACPTCYELSKKLDLEKYQVIETNSTAQSIALLQNKKADMILAGRTLKPHEPQLEYMVIDEGYSFLSNQGKTIFINQLNDYNVYTDLNAEELKEKLSIEKIQTVDNVYEYLDKGIVITSWENTDYNQAEIVHLLEKNRERVKLSRRPTVYCPNVCGAEAQELVLKLK